MGEIPEQKRSGKMVALTIAVLIALYLLGIGPAGRLLLNDYPHSQRGRQVWKLYWPITQAARYPVIGAPIAKYVALWLPHDGRCGAVQDPAEGVMVWQLEPGAP